MLLMQRQHTGRPGTVVIPASWGQTHASVIDKATATASTVTIGAEGPATWDEDLGRTVLTIPDPTYAGAAELMAVSDSARALTVVEDPIAQRVYDVALPYAAGAAITPDMVVRVDAGDPDPTLAGRTLRVRAIERGSRRFSRVLLAVLLD
jgi:uncharacterized protein DUF6093